jgi:hypothetical protein
MRKRRLAPYLWILAATFAGHALLPFVTLVVSDDWFTLLAYREASLESAWTGAVFLSMPLTVLQSLPFFLIGDSLPVLRAINFFVLWGIGASLFAVLNQLAPSMRRENTWVAVIAVVFPGYMVHFMVSFLFYPLGLLLFLLGLWLALRGEETRGRGRYVCLASSALLTFYSFHFGALLVAYVLFVAAHLFNRWRQAHSDLVTTAIDYVARRYVFLLLPFWFWLLRQAVGILLPVWGQYNQPKLDQNSIRDGMAVFGRAYGRILSDLVFNPWFVSSFILAGIILFFVRRKQEARPSAWPSVVAIASGAWVLILGILPFVLVGKHPMRAIADPRHYSAFELADVQILEVIDTRMHLFLGIAAGLIIVHVAVLVRRYIPRFGPLASAFILAVVISSAAIHTRHYVKLQCRAITMEGVAARLKESPVAAASGIVGVVDRIGNVSTTWDSWVLFLETVWGTRKHHGVPERWYGEHLNSAIVYNGATIINRRLYGGAWYKYFSQPDETAQQATLILGPGEALDQMSESQAVIQYYLHRLRRTTDAREFAKRFATVTAIPKFNLGAWLMDPGCGANWAPLSLAKTSDEDTTEADDANHTLAPAAPHAVVLGGRLTFGCLNAAQSGAGRYLLVEVSGARRTLDAPINVYGTNRNLLPTVSLWREDVYVALALLAQDERKVEISADPEAFVDGVELTLQRVIQQQCSDAPHISVLIEPYFGPPENCRLKYRSMLDIPQYLMPQLLWRLDFGGKRSAIKSSSSEVVFVPGTPQSKLSTDYIEVQKDAQIFVRVEWGGGRTPTTRAQVTVESDSGTRLLDLKWPGAPGARIYQVPVSPDTHKLALVVKGSSGSVQLPSRISMIQIDDVLSEALPIESYFPPGR